MGNFTTYKQEMEQTTSILRSSLDEHALVSQHAPSLTTTDKNGCPIRPGDLLHLSAHYTERMLAHPDGMLGKFNLIHRPGNPWIAPVKDEALHECLFCGNTGCKRPYRSWLKFAWGSADALLRSVPNICLPDDALSRDPWIALQMAVRLDGLTVLDCDPRHGGPNTPEKAFDELESLGIVLSEQAKDTVIVRTGGGGLHIYFSGTTNFRWGDRDLDAGMSVLSGGGKQATAPFSFHSAGAFYLPISRDGALLFSKENFSQVGGKIQPFPTDAFSKYRKPIRSNLKQTPNRKLQSSKTGFFNPSTHSEWVQVGDTKIPGDWGTRAKSQTSGRNSFLASAKYAFRIVYRCAEDESNKLICVLNSVLPVPLEQNELDTTVLLAIPQEKIDQAQKVVPGSTEVAQQDASTRLASMQDLMQCGFHDAGNAERWKLVSPDHLYVPGWGWMSWGDGVWTRLPSDQPPTYEYVKRVAEPMYTTAKAMVERSQGDGDGTAEVVLKFSSGLANEPSVAKALSLARVRAREDTRYPTDFDGVTTAEVLSTPTEMVDLRTGASLPHSTKHLVTKQTAVSRDEGAPSLWIDCLNTWQPDKETQTFLQTLVGSGLTGHPLDKFVINSGDGANGKSVFWGVIAQLLGSYSAILPEDLIVKKPLTERERCVVEIAGARLVVASELESASQMNEAMVKLLTGGERLQARHLYREVFEVSPTWSMVLHTNEEPSVRGTDHGIWRRILYVTWDVQIPEQKQDKRLAQTLIANEGGKILSWAVDGAKMFLAAGGELRISSSMDVVKKDRQEAYDTAAEFFQEHCTFEAGKSTSKSKLYNKFLEVMRHTAPTEPIVSQIAFGKKLGSYAKANDFCVRSVRKNNSRFWEGVVLREGELSPPAWA